MSTKDPDEWYCDHCGEYFPALSRNDVCPCGAPVNADVGIAEMADHHTWTPPGAEVCLGCVA